MNLADRIAAWLAEHGPATAPEVARGVCRRDEVVREALKGDARFGLVPRPGLSTKAKSWTVVPALVPEPGTSQERLA
jgi:hypothetical protein